MISLRKFLSQDNETEHALLHAIRFVIQGIGKYGAVGDGPSCERFHESIDPVSRALLGEVTQEDLLVHAGAVIKALEEHHRDFERRRGEHDSDFQKMVQMLTSTVGMLSAAGAENTSRLSEIEKQVASASQGEDVRLIKGRLADCLGAIRNEAARQRQETGETIDRLRQALVEAGERPKTNSVSDEPDRVTGLAQRAAAEAALCDAGQEGAPAFVAVLVLDRLQALNVRFGRSVGDEVLNRFSAAVLGKLPAADRLFRWGGPALVALISHAGNIEQARGDISRIMDAKLEYSIETASRSILIPVAARWAVFPMMASPRLLYQRIDTFTSVVRRD